MFILEARPPPEWLLIITLKNYHFQFILSDSDVSTITCFAMKLCKLKSCLFNFGVVLFPSVMDDLFCNFSCHKTATIWRRPTSKIKFLLLLKSCPHVLISSYANIKKIWIKVVLDATIQCLFSVYRC